MRCTFFRARLVRAVRWLCILSLAGIAEGATTTKQTGTFFPTPLLEAIRANCMRYEWARETRDLLVTTAEPWSQMSDEKLWSLMFGPTITRSWMVWSNGHCPACKQSVPMYNWQVDAIEQPWKMRCPHCQELFPKNDFEAFYRSGLDEHGIFDPDKADRSLLFNVEHPDPADPLHTFGVDDGNGYVDGDKRWRFIGAYLIYGQWKHAVLGGVRALAAAYVVTGDPVYAHKAGILIDRVADVYPTFDFKEQAILYEGPGARGYVSTWHDACEEVRELAIAYDQVFDAIKDDAGLLTFLADKARHYRLSSPKNDWSDVQRNIEHRIFHDTLANNHKIRSNYPRTDIANAVIHLVLAGPEHEAEADEIIDALITKGTAVDGVTGEKGLAGYARIGPTSIAAFLSQLDLIAPGRLAEIYKRHPRLYDCFRFHIDTWCLNHYYPTCGDAGSFASRNSSYAGVDFLRPEQRRPTAFATGPLAPSMYTFMVRMYELTGDPAFIQVTWLANDRSPDGLPYDLFATDPDRIRALVGEVIAREGETPKVGSVNKTQWCLAILRSGQGQSRRAVWLDYDSVGAHRHQDGLNLGLYAYGLDLLPDFGYPPVQYGGWGSPRARWYTMTAAHNTVVVDGENQGHDGVGRTELWADGQAFGAIRASLSDAYKIPQYERTVASIDISEDAFYVFDVFRVVGGTDHAMFTSSQFATIATEGLALHPSKEYGHNTLLRDFWCDPVPTVPWQVDFKIDDRHGHRPDSAPDVHLRYTSLTEGAEANLCEAWVVAGLFDSVEEAWVPRIMTRRHSEEGPLASTFVSVLEPYEKTPHIVNIERVRLTTDAGIALGDAHAAVTIALADGRHDLLVAIDSENPLKCAPELEPGAWVAQPDAGFASDAALTLVRFGTDGAIERIAMAQGSRLRCGPMEMQLSERTDLVEVLLSDGRATVVVGEPARVQVLTIDGRDALNR